MQRRIRNVVKNYTPTEIKVREATSNDPWGPSSILMSEISTLTFDVLSRGEVMGIIWRRLNDHGKNWRHVYKSLVLLNFLVRMGSDWVVRECRDNIIFIQTLRDFQYSENGLDCGLNIREASKKLYDLLKDERKLREERHRAHKSRLGDSRIYSSSIGDLTSDQFNAPSSHTSYKAETMLPKNSSPPINRSPVAAVVATSTEAEEDEDEELQLALALSKEEHDAEETKRRNDEVRLKMALEESKRTAQLDNQRLKQFVPSLVDQNDPWEESSSKNILKTPRDPNSIDAFAYSASGGSSLIAGLESDGRGLSNFNNQSEASKKSFDDDFEEISSRGLHRNHGDQYNGANWQAATHSQSGLKSSSLGDLLSSLNDDLMYPINNNNNNNFNNNDTNNNFNNIENKSNLNNGNNNSDLFGLFDNNNNNNNNNDETNEVVGGINLLTMTDNQSEAKAKKKTAEEFLGDNAKLVNLEQLVVMPTKQESTNPFAITTTKPPVNPFSQLKQPQKVPLNQLQTSSVQSAAFMQFDNSTYNQPPQASLPPLLPQQPPNAFNNNYNPFL